MLRIYDVMLTFLYELSQGELKECDQCFKHIIVLFSKG